MHDLFMLHGWHVLVFCNFVTIGICFMLSVIGPECLWAKSFGFSLQLQKQ